MAGTVTLPQTQLNRREFLYYAWAASMALFTAEATGMLIWFMLPRFRDGEFGGLFSAAVAAIPDVNAPPISNAEGRFWLVNVDSSQESELMSLAPDESQPIVGVAAIYKVCTHLGCIYNWNESNSRFECPCHGSKYRLDGRRIESPAPRSLDRFKVIAVDADGRALAESGQDETGAFEPLVLPEGTATLQIDTGNRQDGPALTLLCTYSNSC